LLNTAVQLLKRISEAVRPVWSEKAYK